MSLLNRNTDKETEMTKYDEETLTALYKVYDHMNCAGMDVTEINKAICEIEAKYKEAA